MLYRYRYKRPADEVKMIQNPLFLWKVSARYSDLLFYCIVIVFTWELEDAKKAVAAGDASKAGRVGEIEEILIELALCFKVNGGCWKGRYDVVVGFLKSSGDQDGVPPLLIGGEKRACPVFCKSLMRMVKFGPAFVELLEKAQEPADS
jgi:hypothetical protein